VRADEDELRSRRGFVDVLREQRRVRTRHVEAAMLSVDRTKFAPGHSLHDVYGDRSLITERNADGRPTSSVSAGWLQAEMLEASGIGPGMRVLEVGSGGYNAALISRIVGSDGCVYSLDIDPSVLARARAGAALQDDPPVNLEFVLQDAWSPEIDDFGPLDALIVTVDLWDIPWALVDQLRPGGTVVVPMRIDGINACFAFTKVATGLTGRISGGGVFVGAQGHGSAVDEAHYVWDGSRSTVLSSSAPIDMSSALFDAALAGRTTTHRTGIRIGDITVFELFLWLLSHGAESALWGSADGSRPARFTGLSPLGTPTYLAAPGGFATLSLDKSEGLPFELTITEHSSAQLAVSRLAGALEAWQEWSALAGDPAFRLEPRHAHAGAETRASGWQPVERGVFLLDEGRPNTVVLVDWRSPA
jgi:protein-L-isoaspartate(D-aspartate) O-methyltransferase